jgi:hypothetical protein
MLLSRTTWISLTSSPYVRYISYHFGGWRPKNNPEGFTSDLTRSTSRTQQIHTLNLLNVFGFITQYVDRLFSFDFFSIRNRYASYSLESKSHAPNLELVINIIYKDSCTRALVHLFFTPTLSLN